MTENISSKLNENVVKCMEIISKEKIADICEELYNYCVSQIPQIENDKLIWFLNGSTLCNMLYNVRYIDGVEVNEQFNNYCYDFIRQPKGDIDITYTPDRRYKFDLSNEKIAEFQSISEEQRTYNFVDSNSELDERDLKQICKMTTKNGFSFYAKKPQYLFLYKFKEFLAIFNKEILENNYNEINKRKKNMINDVKILYNISISYCGNEETLKAIDELPNLSSYLHELYENDINSYKELLRVSLNLLTKEEQIIRK